MFLRPQHFQQLDHYHDRQRLLGLRGAHPYFWGVTALEIDSEALGNGFFRLSRLQATFPDGDSLTAPEGDPLPSPRQLTLDPNLGDGVLVYIGLPHLSEHDANCDFGDTASRRPRRFHKEERSLPDLYTEALDSDITLLKRNVQVLLEHENLDDYLVLPIARLRKNTLGQFSLDPDFIPATSRTGAAPGLKRIVQRLLDILLAKHGALAGVHREASKDVLGFRSTDIASFWLLHAINAGYASLQPYHHSDELHPFSLYQLLSTLCGELFTFSTRYTLADLPAYHHLKPTDAFLRLDDMIRDLLETVISVRYVTIPLSQSKPSVFVGSLEDERLVSDADFYLSVSANMPPGELTNTVPLRLKIGSPDDVEKMIASAIPGVRLVQPTHTPSALPVRAGNYYFSLDPRGTVFDRMLRARAVAIYVPDGFNELNLELIGVLR